MVGYITLVIIWVMAFYGIYKCNYISVNILTIFAMFQNFILILISGSISSTLYSLIILTKEIYVVLLILCALVKRMSLIVMKFDLGCILCVLLLFLMSIMSSANNLMSVLASFRQLYLPFIFYLMGRMLNLSYEEIKKIIVFFVKVSLVAVIFGIIEWATGDLFWSHTSITQYYNFKGYSRYVQVGRILHGGIYSYDFYPLFIFRRMISFMADPVILGQFLSVSVIITIFEKDLIKNKKKRYLCICILGVGLLLTFTKGGVIITAIAFIVLVSKIWKKYILSNLALSISMICIILFLSFAFANNQSALNHLKGLLDGFSVMGSNIFGVGIGRYGNMTSLYSNAIVEGSGESFIGSMVAQIGIIGILIYGYFYINLFLKLRKEKSEIAVIIYWLDIALFITAFFNNTAISFTNCFIFFILAGACISQKVKKECIIKEANYSMFMTNKIRI